VGRRQQGNEVKKTAMPRSKARIYRKAATLIEEWGELGKFDLCNDGRHCAEAAIYLAAGFVPPDRLDWSYDDVVRQLGSAREKDLCTLSGGRRVFELNDSCPVADDGARAAFMAKKLRTLAGPAR
jgi:hypothetical protein